MQYLICNFIYYNEIDTLTQSRPPKENRSWTLPSRESGNKVDEGLRFAIREGGRTVGAGVVTKIIE